MKTTNITLVVNVTNVNDQGDSPSANKGRDTSSPRKNQPIDNIAGPNAVVSSAGLKDGRIGDCLFHKPEEVTHSLAQIEVDLKDSNEEFLWEHMEGNLEGGNNRPSAKGEAFPLFNKRNCPEDLAYTRRFKDVKQSQSEDISSENYHKGVTPHLTYLQPVIGKCAQTLDLNDALGSQHSSFNFLIEPRTENCNQGMIVTSEPSNEGKECIHSMCQKGESPLIESPSHENVSTLNWCKGKKRVSSTRRTRGFSNEKDDSYESVESSNNTELFVTGKRVWSFGKEMLMGGKRMKKSSDKNSCSEPNVIENSSFVNWISSVTSGLFGSDNVEGHSSTLVPFHVPNKERDIFSTAMSNDSNKDAAPRSVGFGSIFKALYDTRLEGKSKTDGNDYPGDSGSSRDLQFEKITVVNNRSRLLRDGKGIVLHKPVPISSMRMEQGICQCGEPLPAASTISVSNSLVQEKVKHNMGEHCDLHNVDFSTSSLKNGSSSSSEGKEAGKLSSYIPDKSSNLSIMNKASMVPASAWITRFLPKVSAPMEHTTQCNQGTFLESENHIDDCNTYLSHVQIDVDSVRDCNNSDNCRQSPLEDQRRISKHLQQYSISGTGLCSKKVHTDLRAKYNLNPILPSQKFKKLEPITSVFAKRSDTFRHIQTSEVADNMTPESATCFFCGKNDHIITSCSGVIESELDDLLENINSLGGTENQACLCIRCFRNDHWAVMCPYAFPSHHHDDGNASIINSENVVRTIKGGGESPLLSNHGIRICTKGEGRQCQLHSTPRIPCGNKSRNATKIIVDEKTAMKGKQIASSSAETKLRDKSFVCFYNLAKSKKPDEQPRIFKRLRKLRLSRTDVIRWMESSTSQFSLEGFFLRVKLKKWVEDQGGTCYHVACIDGTSDAKLYGCSKSQLPVNIGGSKCLIDFCFISNNDFAEDELKAWWSWTLRSGDKLPSEEDLDKKLHEREKLDFLSLGDS